MQTIHKLLTIQKPHYQPNPSDEAINFSDPFEVIVFIVLPIIIIGLYVYWRKTKKQQ